MTKKTVIIIITVIIGFSIIGALNTKKDEITEKKSVTVVQVAATPTSSQIDTYAGKIGATDKTEADYVLIGAKDGAKYQLNGKTVEIYQFDKDKLVDGMKQLYGTDPSVDDLEIRRVDNTVFVFHGYPEDSAEVDTIISPLI